jgi:hypothetical protein
MPIISNTSPLLNLAIIDHLDLVREQFTSVLVPEAVLEELCVDTALPGASVLRQALTEGWIQVQDVENRALVQLLRRNLDRGESEAIALAIQHSATWLLLDERDGRLAAKALEIPVTGVLGILLRAKHEGQIASLRVAMEKLRDQAGFHIAPALFDDVLRAGGEL